MRPEGVVRLRVVPLTFRQANSLVGLWHRHHKPVQGYRFALGVVDELGVVRGCAIAGRPVARLSGRPEAVLEVTRVATDGVPNGCSMLLGACARVGKSMGFEKIQTYTLSEEGGSSLRGAGWVLVAQSPGGQWKHSDGRPRRSDQPDCAKNRWELRLNDPVPQVVVPEGG
jgi:hypothetical protein